MSTVLFFFLAALMVGFGLAVVVNRNPVTSALCLVASFLCLAALLVQLDAFFIGIIQVLVYGGAVMVLFLFIIMLMDLKSEERRHFNLPALFGGAALALLLAWQVVVVVDTFKPGSAPMPNLDFAAATTARTAELARTASLAAEKTEPDKGKAEALAAELTRKAVARDGILKNINSPTPSLPDAHLVGEILFTRFNLHLQVVAVLLLVATLGVVLLSKRKLA